MAKKTAKKTSTTKNAKKPKRATQKNLTTMEDIVIQELDDAGLLYIEARDNRMAWMVTEKERKESLIEAMRRNDQKTYRFSNQLIEYKRGVEENLTVRKIKDPKEE